MASFTAATGAGLVSALMTLLGIGMGLAVPATSMAVMGSVARERSGMASATMNALRQTGMAVGIALLGTLMNAQTVEALARRLAGAGAADALAVARAAITQHTVPAALRGAYAEAMASGFQAAMIAAGGAALLAAALLAAERFRRPVAHRELAGNSTFWPQKGPIQQPVRRNALPLPPRNDPPALAMLAGHAFFPPQSRRSH